MDASALLAVLNREPGGDVVARLLDGAAMSAVNWCETFQKASARGVPTDGLRDEVEALGVAIVPFDSSDAEDAAHLWRDTAPAGLSLGDRACLALARREGIFAVTTDRAWSSLAIDIEVNVVR